MKPNAAEIFHAALELPPEQRDGFLLGACGKDLALRSKVEALLRSDAEAGRFMASPTVAPDGPAVAGRAQEQAGAMIGRYKLLEQIGEGGMGAIWMAEQREPVLRRVALKIIKLGMDTKQVIARFEAERQALAMMDHPHIAKVLDAGATDTGRPYFVMEYIKGIPILEYCDQERLDTQARLELFTKVCNAIQHAHQKGIIHRDIKPSNVLVTMHDGVPVPKVIDFGIAKATNSVLTTKTLFTEHRQMIGTPAYMSPEQAEMSGLDIDTRSDVYSLGVLLYELLTGTTPFDMRTLLASGLAEMMRTIREVDPHKPSARVSTLGDTGSRTAMQRRVDVQGLGTLLRGDLDWIVMKCLEKDRTRRYETANGLAADIRRHLANEPVTAGSPTAGYRLRKFVRRNRAQVLAGGVVLLAALLAAAGGVWGIVQTNRAKTVQLERQLESEQRAAVDAARVARNAEAMAALLPECEQALRGGDVTRAQIALGEAVKRAAEGVAEQEARRIDALTADLTLLVELKAIDQLRWTWVGNRFVARDVVAVRTRDALRAFGADPSVTAQEACAERVNASIVSERIVTTLDRLLERERSPAVRAVLRQVDADPFRDAIRDAVVAGDRARLVTLVMQAEAMEQPPGFATVLGDNPSIAAERRQALLEAALVRQSGDIGLLMTLGTLAYEYPTDQQESQIERMRWFQAAIAVDPGNLAARNDLAAILSERGYREAAAGHYGRILALDPDNSNAHSNFGLLLTRLGRVDEGIGHLEAAIRAKPDAAVAHSNLGFALREKGLLDESEAALRRAVAFDPSSVQAGCELSTTLILKGALDEAIGTLQRTIQQEPDYASAYSNLGIALRLAGRAEEAVLRFRKAVALDPDNAEFRLGLSRALAEAGDTDEAIAAARMAVELDPDAVACRIQLGAVLRELAKDHDGALACFEAAVALDPESADARTGVGSALLGKGRVADAVRCLREAIALDAKLPQAHFELGGALVRSAAAARSTGADATGLQMEALGALRQALVLTARSVQDGTMLDRHTAVLALRAWLDEPGLASARDVAAMAGLPAVQRRGFAQLRADAAALLSEAEKVPQPAPALADAPDPILPMLEQALQQKRDELGADSPELAHATWRLGRHYRELGKLDRAIELLEDALQRARTAYGPDNPSTPGILNELGVAYSSAGLPEESIVFLEESLKLHEALFGRSEPRSLLTAANLGVSYKNAGRSAEAVPLLMAVVQAESRPPGMDWVAYQLFEALSRLEPAVAAVHYGKLLPSLRNNPGEDQGVKVSAMFYCGQALAGAGRFAEAEPLLEAALECGRATFRSDSAELLDLINAVGVIWLNAKRFDKVVPLFEDSLELHEAKYGPNHEGTLATTALLGVSYMENGRLPEAIGMLMRVQLVTPRPASLQWTTPLLFDALLRAEPADALGHWQQVLPVLRRDPGEDDMVTLIARVNVGHTLSRTRRFAEADAMLAATIADLLRVFGEGSEILLNARGCLAESYLLQQRYAEAERLLRPGLAEREKSEPGSWRVATAQYALGRALAGQGMHAEAESLLIAAHDGLQANAGTAPVWASRYALDTLRALAELCEGLGRSEDAVRWRSALDALDAERGSGR